MELCGSRKKPFSREGSSDLIFKPKLAPYSINFVCANAHLINIWELICCLQAVISNPWLHKRFFTCYDSSLFFDTNQKGF